MPLAARLRLLSCVCAAVWLAACTLPANPPAQPPPRPTRTPFARGAPAAARATPDPRVQWPPDVPALLPAGAAIVNMSEVDTDGDGEKEMLVIYALDGAGRGLVIRREGAAGRAYALGGSIPAELFRERWSDNTVADVNGDGRSEVVVEGVVAGAAEQVSVFQWNGTAYLSLLSLSGAEGVSVDDPRQDGMLEFSALEFPFPRSGMARSTRAAWKAGAYRLAADYHFLLGAPLRLNYPEQAVLAYYVFWRDAQPAKMLALLADPQRSLTTPESLAAQTRSLAGIAVANLRVDEDGQSEARVTAVVRTLPLGIQSETYVTHSWRLVNLDDGWHLAELSQP